METKGKKAKLINIKKYLLALGLGSAITVNVTGCSSNSAASETTQTQIEEDEKNHFEYYVEINEDKTTYIVEMEKERGRGYYKSYNSETTTAANDSSIKKTVVYDDSHMTKEHVLIIEQSKNIEGTIMMFNLDGTLDFYKGYQLIQKIDLKTNQTIDISNKDKNLLENSEYLYNFESSSNENTLIKTK